MVGVVGIIIIIIKIIFQKTPGYETVSAMVIPYCIIFGCTVNILMFKFSNVPNKNFVKPRVCHCMIAKRAAETKEKKETGLSTRKEASFV